MEKVWVLCSVQRQRLSSLQLNWHHVASELEAPAKSSDFDRHWIMHWTCLRPGWTQSTEMIFHSNRRSSVEVGTSSNTTSSFSLAAATAATTTSLQAWLKEASDLEIWHHKPHSSSIAILRLKYDRIVIYDGHVYVTPRGGWLWQLIDDLYPNSAEINFYKPQAYVSNIKQFCSVFVHVLLLTNSGSKADTLFSKATCCLTLGHNSLEVVKVSKCLTKSVLGISSAIFCSKSPCEPTSCTSPLVVHHLCPRPEVP